MISRSRSTLRLCSSAWSVRYVSANALNVMSGCRRMPWRPSRIRDRSRASMSRAFVLVGGFRGRAVAVSVDPKVVVPDVLAPRRRGAVQGVRLSVEEHRRFTSTAAFTQAHRDSTDRARRRPAPQHPRARHGWPGCQADAPPEAAARISVQTWRSDTPSRIATSRSRSNSGCGFPVIPGAFGWVTSTNHQHPRPDRRGLLGCFPHGGGAQG